jgi:uncharacterized membrane protein
MYMNIHTHFEVGSDILKMIVAPSMTELNMLTIVVGIKNSTQLVTIKGNR